MSKKMRATRKRAEGVRSLALRPREPEAVRHGFHSFHAIDIAAVAMLAIATLAVYSHAIQNPFVTFDDPNYVTENHQVQSGLNWETLRWAFTTTEAANWHPITWISHAIDCQFFGLKAWGHHLTSVLLHLINCLLLLFLLWRSTGALGRSLFVAALFALHPLNVESVAWIAERKNLVSMLFLLLTLGAYGWYARRPRVLRYLCVFVLFAVGLSAKPMIVTAPLLLLLVDIWPLHRVSGWNGFAHFYTPLAKLVLEKLPLLGLTAASSLITMKVQHPAMETGVPLAVRFSNAVYSYGCYLERMVLPTKLAAFYPYEGFRLSWPEVSGSLLLLIGITALVLRARLRPYLFVGWFWFLGALVPMIGVVQVGDQGTADRYAYLPLIGCFTALTWLGADLAGRFNVGRSLTAAMAIALIGVLSFLTWNQIETWGSDYALWAHAVDSTEGNYMAENFLGQSLLLASFHSTGQRRSEEAAVHFRNAVRFNPEDPTSRINLGGDLHELGRLEEAVEQYQVALRLTADPNLRSKALIDLGAAYHQLEQYTKARECYMEALKLQPNNMIIFVNLGQLAMDERVAQLATAVSAKPSPEAYFELGKMQQSAGHVSQARESYLLALKLDPKLSSAKTALDNIDSVR